MFGSTNNPEFTESTDALGPSIHRTMVIGRSKTGMGKLAQMKHITE